MGLLDELKTRNFSIYAQWMGVLSIVLCLALGIANFIASLIPIKILIFIWSIATILMGIVLIFVEIPFLLRICPTNDRFDGFIRKFNNNWSRAGIYAAFAVFEFLSTIQKSTSLIAVGVFELFAALFYGIDKVCAVLSNPAIAAFKGQEFTSSSALGGMGVAQRMVV